jgi:predicted ATP-dependent Lon-type protease
VTELKPIQVPNMDMAELFAKFQMGFYSDPVNGVFKAIGVE